MSAVEDLAAVDGRPDVAALRMPALRGMLSDNLARVGFGLTLFLLAVVIIGPLVAPHSITDFVAPKYSGPSSAAPLGTDNLGRDVLSRTLHGGASLLWMAVAATALGVAVGTLAGMVAAYVGGVIGSTIMRVIDVLLAFPYIILVLLFISILGAKSWLLVLMVAFGWVPVVARVGHATTLDAVSQEYVQASEMIGVSRTRVVTQEVLPNLMTPVMVQFGQYLTFSIGVLAGMSFLGFGAAPPTPDWGVMISENREALSVQPWPVIAPVALIAIFAVGTNLLAESYAKQVGGIE